MTTQTVYRLYDEGGCLIYVGVTNDWERRLIQHRVSRPELRDFAKAEFEYFGEDRKAAELREAELIKIHSPKHNRAAGRKPKPVSEAVLTERIEFRVSPAMKEWIAEHGYGAYLRRLVEEDRDKEGKQWITP